MKGKEKREMDGRGCKKVKEGGEEVREEDGSKEKRMERRRQGGGKELTEDI